MWTIQLFWYEDGRNRVYITDFITGVDVRAVNPATDAGIIRCRHHRRVLEYCECKFEAKRLYAQAKVCWICMLVYWSRSLRIKSSLMLLKPVPTVNRFIAMSLLYAKPSFQRVFGGVERTSMSLWIVSGFSPIGRICRLSGERRQELYYQPPFGDAELAQYHARVQHFRLWLANSSGPWSSTTAPRERHRCSKAQRASRRVPCLVLRLFCPAINQGILQQLPLPFVRWRLFCRHASMLQSHRHFGIGSCISDRMIGLHYACRWLRD